MLPQGQSWVYEVENPWGGLEGRQLPAPSGGCSGLDRHWRRVDWPLEIFFFPHMQIWSHPSTVRPHPLDPCCRQMRSSARCMRLSQPDTDSATLISCPTLARGSLTSRFLNTFCMVALPCSLEGPCGPPLPPLGSSSLGLNCSDASDLIAILWYPPGWGPITGISTWTGWGGHPSCTSTE